MKKTLLILMFFFFVNLISFSQQIDSTDVTKNITEEMKPKSETNVFNILSLVIGLVGIVGTFYTIKAFTDSKKNKREIDYLIDIAGKNIRKDITEKEIKEKKKNLKEYSNKIIELQNKIKNEIPQQARLALLKDKLNTETELLISTYESIKKINSELKSKEKINDIPQEIKKAIENEINPTYLQKEKQSKLKNYITILTTLAAILAAAVPPPLNRIVSIPIFIILIPPLFKFAKSYIPKDRESRRAFIFKYLMRLPLSVGLIAVMYFAILLVFHVNGFYRLFQYDILIFGIIISIIVSLVGGVLHFISRRKLKRLIEYEE